ncbi:GIY-YIG nuclease family protein [Clostridium estertheticum]|uniref:GIY-YIG nuclease family protein n=1 Tax=Clostridium estertheticum TaxID=238834 RepID=UPI001C7D8A13|nr:hypothetical protein [Clostridium estertheticum]MBX4271905.1 hypothetical protein [Clostridium estertheticum]WLC82378.1 hypothetical protein KTC98_23675 [Clostridium estertheticum]
MKELLNKLLENTFIPTVDTPTKLPDEAGAYLICAKDTDLLPERMKELEYMYVNGLPVIYVGIAGRPTSRVKSIRKRDYRNHFNGKARSSTLRKSLGVLFGFEKEYENEPNKLKYKFIDEHEEKLSKWMKDNLIMHFVRIDNPMEFEIYLINTYEPPLNLKDNKSEKNRDFRKELSRLRTR